LTLVVAADPEQLDEIEATIFDSVVAACAAALTLGIVGGVGLSLAMLWRVASIRRAAESIIAGNLEERISVPGSDDDFDRL
jgi:hypothetical protein